MKFYTALALTLLALPAVAEDAPTKLPIDADWAVKGDRTRIQSVTFEKDGTLHVEVAPVKNAAKGFFVRVIPFMAPSPATMEALKSCSTMKGPCKDEVKAWSYSGDKAFSHSGKLAKGRWSLLVGVPEDSAGEATLHVKAKQE